MDFIAFFGSTLLTILRASRLTREVLVEGWLIPKLSPRIARIDTEKLVNWLISEGMDIILLINLKDYETFNAIILCVKFTLGTGGYCGWFSLLGGRGRNWLQRFSRHVDTTARPRRDGWCPEAIAPDC